MIAANYTNNFVQRLYQQQVLKDQLAQRAVALKQQVLPTVTIRWFLPGLALGLVILLAVK